MFVFDIFDIVVFVDNGKGTFPPFQCLPSYFKHKY